MIRPTRAMLLAAGRGERMRPLTDKTPKPLLPVQGRSLAERALDRLAEAGVEQAVVNLHHLGEELRRCLEARSRPQVVFSEEDDLLDTGGGVAKALPLLGEAPFFVVNGDALWLDGAEPALQRLCEAWDEARMDALLLLQPTVSALGFEGLGDFFLTPDGRVRRRIQREVAPFAYAGVQLVHPRLLKDAPLGAFSFNLLWDRALESERLWGLRHEGPWYHVGTPEALALAEQELTYELGAPRPEASD